jgi:hypothetical protein
VADWGSTPAERDEAFPCDRLVDRPDLMLFRALDVAAPVETVFRWLCQLRVAPYSYDLIDNGGRRSPQTLTPGLEQLAVGQRMMLIFKLVEFEPGTSVTVLSEGRVFGRVAVTYRVTQVGERRSRLVAKVLVKHPRRGILSRLGGLLLAPGDLVMMRRQLMNLRDLAEAEEAGA